MSFSTEIRSTKAGDLKGTGGSMKGSGFRVFPPRGLGCSGLGVKGLGVKGLGV